MASNSSPAPTAPKILLAKPGLVASGSNIGKLGRGGGASEDELLSLRSRLPAVGSLNLISENWDFITDRFLPFLTENTDFTVVGVIGPAGVGKSTILNEICGHDGSSPGMLPMFSVQTDDTRAASKHCTTGIEPRITSERIILLDTQPLFSPSVLSEMVRPDGSSSIPVLNGESVTAELAHELMSIQVDLLKHGIPDPSSNLSHSQTSLGLNGGNQDKESMGGDDYMATPIFVHTKVHEFSSHTVVQLEKALTKYFKSSTFTRTKAENQNKASLASPEISNSQRVHDSDSSTLLKLYAIPLPNKDKSISTQRESYRSMLWKLRDKVLSMNTPSFAKTVSERDWLRNSAKIWETIKSSPIIADYAIMLQTSGAFRK